MQRNALLIARVSDADQRKALPAQKLRLERYAFEKKLNYRYFEFDESARKGERKKFSSLVDDLEKTSEFVVLVFDKIDRFSRDSSQSEVNRVKRLLDANRLELHFPSDNLFITYASPAADRFRLGIGMILGEYYSDAISDTVKRRFEQIVNDGQFPHKAPLGYVNVKREDVHEKAWIEPDPATRHYIKKMFELRSEGVSYGAIANIMQKDGLRHAKGKITKGKPISRAHVERILNNPFYYGKMIYKGEEKPHRYEPIITKELYIRSQEASKIRSSDKSKYDSKPFIFRGLIRCGRCQSRMSSYSKKGLVYLRCSKSGRDKCGNPNTSENLILPVIAQILTSIQIPHETVQKTLRELQKRHNNERMYYSKALETERKELLRAEDEQEKVISLFIDGSITREVYDRYVKNLEGRIERHKERIITLSGNDDSFVLTAEHVMKIANDALQIFESSKTEDKARILKTLFSNLTLDNKTLKYELSHPYKSILKVKSQVLSEPGCLLWRRRGDSNSRSRSLRTNDLANHPLKPLGYPSVWLLYIFVLG
jgi:site-specific DNA recombinase